MAARRSQDSEVCIDRRLYSQGIRCVCSKITKQTMCVCIDQARGHEAMVEHAEYNVITKTVILNQGSPAEARSNIRQYFKDTFDLDSSLFDHIKPQVCITLCIFRFESID